MRSTRFLAVSTAAALILAAACQQATAAVVPPPNPLGGASLWSDPESSAARQARAWRSSRPGDAALLEYIARQPQAKWLGEWSGDVRAEVARTLASADGRVPVLVAYNIPGRDCGQWSSGGAAPNEYRAWIRDLAAGIGSRRAVVILEPDALALTDCLTEEGRAARIALVRDAVETLSARPGVSVYLDAGHARWHQPDEIAARLRAAGVAMAAGFALNVSNYVGDAESVGYGERVSGLLGGAHFVVDSSRNGAGSAGGEWCNPAGRALGRAPTTGTDHPLVDAYLWVKRPGESDGECNGGPRAGEFWPEYALELAQRSPAAEAERLAAR